MKTEFKEKWIQALESGKYNKGFGSLKVKTPKGKICHCALGVLVEELGFPSQENHTYSNKFTEYHFIYETDKKYVYMVGEPDIEISENVGLSPSDISKIITLNDKQDMAFRDIANWIKENL